MEKWKYTVVRRTQQKRKPTTIIVGLWRLIVVEGRATSLKSLASKPTRLFPRSNDSVEDLEVKKPDLSSFQASVLLLQKRLEDLFDVC